MLEFLYYLLLFTYVYLMHKNRYKFLLYLIPANFAIDMFVIFFETGGITALIRGLVFGIFLATLIIKSFKYTTKTNYQKKYYIQFVSIIGVILFYWLILIPFSSNMSNSLREYARIAVILMALPAGYALGAIYIKPDELFRKLNKASVFVLIIATINIVIANIFKINQIAYTSFVSFYTGGIQLNQWYTLPLAMLYIAGYKMIYLKSKFSIFERALIFLSFLWVMLSWRRTAFLVLVIGILLLIYYNRISLKLIINLAIISFIAFLIIGSTFLTIYEGRKKTIDKGLEEEGRFIETEWVHEKIYSFEDVNTSLFGTEIFNTPGNYLDGIFGDRPMHVDINIILWGPVLLDFLCMFFYIIKF